MSKIMRHSDTPESWRSLGIFHGHKVEVIKENDGLALIVPVDRDLFTQFRGVIVPPEWVLVSTLSPVEGYL